jgi:hypothetical protein
MVRAACAAALVLAAGCRGRVEPGRAARPTTATDVPVQAAPISAPQQAAISPGLPAKPAVRISPEAFTITADDAGLQLLASDDLEPARDRTGQVTWKAEPAGLAEIEPGGYLKPLAAGVVTVKAALAGASDAPPAEAKVTIEPRSTRPWDFGEDIVPILTRMGCNTGACHGRLEGQNGFHLSLFGYDPAGDYRSVARDGGQRRLSRLAPEDSLFLVKANGRAPHAGGRRLAIGAPEYQVLLSWIKDGAPERRGKSHGAVASVRIEPGSAIRLDEPSTRQLRVVARYADGHVRDVTRLASFKLNDDASASVTPQGSVTLHRRAETDVIVRYESHVLSARISTIINPELAFDFSKLKRRNVIDDELFKRLESLKVPPSPPAGEAAFFRRASLDLTGEQPLPDEIRAFLDDKDPDKRLKLIDRLLKKKEFVLFWRIKLGDLLQISTNRQGQSAPRYQAWIDKCLGDNRAWDDVVKTLLTAVGDPSDLDNGGPVNYAMDTMAANELAELTAQRFLGLRMRCAQCHDHPFDVWTQDAYYGFAAFFAKVSRNAGGGPGMMMGRTRVTIDPKGQVVHLRTQKPVEPRLLDGKAVKVPPAEDPRKALASWITAPDNPYFARAMANWVWAQLFGKGLVDPPDDMSRANPPIHPELLDALAKHFVEHKYDLRDLIRTIVVSEAYGMSSATAPGNEKDTRFFSHHLPRPLTAHQMADALAQATGVPNAFRIGGTRDIRRAIQIYDPATPSSLLDTFGRCSRSVACAASPAPTLSLGQALLLIGGDVIESKVSNLNGYLASALKLELEPEELVENLYFRTVCRPPTAEELSRWSAELKQASSKSEAAEDLFWALLNSREFAFNH